MEKLPVVENLKWSLDDQPHYDFGPENTTHQQTKSQFSLDLALVGFSSEVWAIDICLNLSGFPRADSPGLHSFASPCLHPAPAPSFCLHWGFSGFPPLTLASPSLLWLAHSCPFCNQGFSFLGVLLFSKDKLRFLRRRRMQIKTSGTMFLYQISSVYHV